jgi:hypothetical protein
VLGRDPDATPFRVDGPLDALAITDERAPGAVEPENEVLVSGEVEVA